MLLQMRDRSLSTVGQGSGEGAWVMEWWQIFVLSFCATCGLFSVILAWCMCVLAKRADEAWAVAHLCRQMDQERGEAVVEVE